MLTPHIPDVKALLSVDGGSCPRDGSALVFDPSSPWKHRCPACGDAVEGDRHHRWWARFQHLWLGEQVATHAAAAALHGDEEAGPVARHLINEYAARYLQYPNADNVLGPSRLFFSTYLESIWITNVVAGALLLREAGRLDTGTSESMDIIANEAATLIGEYNEGHSNRQTWNNAALTGLALWFEDEELLRLAVQGPTGLFEHLTSGFLADGMWFEGENYHLFALRGLLIGLCFARSADLDAFSQPELSVHLGRALRAPLLTALPDLTFPARKDSRFGVSLAQPMYLELWEAGASLLPDTADLAAWLETLYAAPAPVARDFDSYLYEAGRAPPARRSRSDLSWWMRTLDPPGHDAAGTRWAPRSVLLESQGLAVLRTGHRYASLECGIVGGGHGHPDRLHLTLHQDGVHWLPDPGTGSYVSKDLFWYRSTLAHNAPMLDGESQEPGDAHCEFFAEGGEWSWARGRFRDFARTIVSGPGHLLDILEYAGAEPHRVELPWHLAGDWELTTATPAVVQCRAGDAVLSLAVHGADELVREVGPGVPGSGPAPYLLARATGRVVRFTTVVARTAGPVSLIVEGDHVTVEVDGVTTRHHPEPSGWVVNDLHLGGPRPAADPSARPAPGWESAAHAKLPAVLEIDREDQYRRSEEPWSEGDVTAAAQVDWSHDGLHCSVDVRKSHLYFRPRDAPPLLLDNDPDDIHSDGLEVFLRVRPGAPVHGFLVVPEPAGALRVAPTTGSGGGDATLTGSWDRTAHGYQVDFTARVPGWEDLVPGDAVGFDLMINEMRPGRERRAGQMVWSGDGGWVWLRGDRHEADHLGTLELT